MKGAYKLFGMACPFNVIEGGKMIARNAFKIQGEITLRQRHDGPDLATTANGTLQVWQDEKGLRFEAMLPEKDFYLIDAINQGRLSYCSAGSHNVVRQLHPRGYFVTQSAELEHIAILSDPHYPQTWIKTVWDSTAVMPITRNSASAQIAPSAPKGNTMNAKEEIQALRRKWNMKAAKAGITQGPSAAKLAVLKQLGMDEGTGKLNARLVPLRSHCRT
jgi:phage head maturation protease